MIRTKALVSAFLTFIGAQLLPTLFVLAVLYGVLHACGLSAGTAGSVAGPFAVGAVLAYRQYRQHL
ncbi:hypothetical protein [Kitasatospora sp. NPDC059571]|uniref:hypothetical protein n=1 Tax=Kitasatospora sp. NPDC059571 TaxID=3346871 RepID=UPI0036A49A2C